MTVVYKTVKRGYAVVAMGAHRGGDKWRCFETHWPPEEHEEIPGVCTWGLQQDFCCSSTCCTFNFTLVSAADDRGHSAHPRCEEVVAPSPLCTGFVVRGVHGSGAGAALPSPGMCCLEPFAQCIMRIPMGSSCGQEGSLLQGFA